MIKILLSIYFIIVFFCIVAQVCLKMILLLEIKI